MISYKRRKGESNVQISKNRSLLKARAKVKKEMPFLQKVKVKGFQITFSSSSIQNKREFEFL